MSKKASPAPARGHPPDRLSISLLGGFHVRVGAADVPDAQWRLRKSKSLVKLLALTPGHRLHREQVMDALWQDLDPAAAAHNLHQALYVARRVLSPDGANPFLAMEEDMLSLAPESDLWIDVEAFQAAAKHARFTHEPSDYLAACEIYRGDLLPEDRYDDQTNLTRDALRSEYLGLLSELAIRYQARDELASALDTWKRALATDPAFEDTHRALMRLYALTGQRALALRQYQNLSEVFRRELDASPSAESEQLYQDILAGKFPPAEKKTVPVSPPVPPVVTEFTSRQIFAATDATRPPVASNLPHPLTSFIGREKEIGELERLLTTTRLLTLTGPGGCGKTRLALKVADEVAAHYASGAWLIELERLHDPALIPNALAAALGVAEQSGINIEVTVTDYLRNRNLLLVLDSCEHLIAACAQLAEHLLGACASLHILTTSLEPLHIAGELTWRVPSLSTPALRPSTEGRRLETYDAVRLFVERAQHVQPDFELNSKTASAVTQICAHLDGIPLAIELAAARTHFLSVQDIAAHLDNRFQLLTGNTRASLARQQTLRATMDWSYDLLAERDKIMWRRVAVFDRSFTLEGITAVVSDDQLDKSVILDLVAHLVDRSIIVTLTDTQVTRYRLLESVRAYGLEKLDAAHETETMRRRHRNYYLSLAASGSLGLQSERQSEWLARLESEHDELRSALEWSASQPSEDDGYLVLCGAMWVFWYIHSYLTEGRLWLKDALDKSQNAPPALKANALAGSGTLAFAQGDFTSATADAYAALGLYESLNDPVGQAHALLILGLVSQYQGDFRDAHTFHEASLALLRQANHQFGMGLALHLLGVVAFHLGEYSRARDLLNEALGVRRNIEDLWGLGLSLHNLANLEQEAGNYARSRELSEESLALFRQVGTRSGIALALTNLGLIAEAQGQTARAGELFLEALGLFDELDDKPGVARALRHLGQVTQKQGDLKHARAMFRGSLALRQELGDKPGVASSIEGLGVLEMAEGNDRRAARLFASAEVLREQTGAPMTTVERKYYEPAIAALQQRLDKKILSQEWTAGRVMTTDSSVMFALDEKAD